MNKQLVNTFIIMYLLLFACLQPANAVLERVGPVSNVPAIGGFPTWYMDTTGIALDFCTPTVANLAGGWCLLLPGNANPPEAFPTNFFDEHFYYSAAADWTNAGVPANLKTVLWESAVEAAFSVGPAIPGDQITFSRIRVRLDPVPVTGTYKFIHPYGEESIEATAGARIFFTDDVGVAAGVFTGAMTSRLGPFLLPSDTPGGAALPAVPGPDAGSLYIADPARVGAVTGSPLGATRNFVRIEGPTGSNLGGPGIDSIETTNFSLMGRLFQGGIDSLMTADRASYTRNAAEQKVDVFATAIPTASSRLPGQPRPAPAPPVVSFFDRPCGTSVDALGNITGFIAPAGASEFLMTAQGNYRWGQIQPALIPNSVCMKDNSAHNATGNPIVTFRDVPVNDEVNITLADYNSTTQTLTVSATSSDTIGDATHPVPTLALSVFGVDLVNGTVTVSGVTAPPAKVAVLSSARGTDSENTTTKAAVAGGTAPVAVNDDSLSLPATVIAEDSGPHILDILANDVNSTGGTVNLVSSPSLGTVVLSLGGTVVTYTPNLNANGNDSFTYTVTTAGGTSNIATVAVTITPVNDAPVAVADSAGGAVNTPLTILILANDSDVDGNQLTISNVSAVTGPGTVKTATVNGNGTITFNANAAGQYTFDYTVTDGSLSATTSVTVSMSPAETLNVTSAQFRTSQLRWVITGTSSIASNQLVTLSFTSGNPALPCDAEGRVIVTANAVAGAFAIDVRPTPANLDPRGTNCANVMAVSATGGIDASTPITIRR